MHLSYNVPEFPMFPAFTTTLTIVLPLLFFIVNISLGERDGNIGNMETQYREGAKIS